MIAAHQLLRLRLRLRLRLELHRTTRLPLDLRRLWLQLRLRRWLWRYYVEQHCSAVLHQRAPFLLPQQRVLVVA